MRDVTDKLVNPDLKSAIGNQFILRNQNGAYLRTNITFANVQKEQGLLVCPYNGNRKQVLVSYIEESVEQNNISFNLSFYKYPGTVHRESIQYIETCVESLIPTSIISVGNIILRKEVNIAQSENILLIRYTLEEAYSFINLKLMPMLAFRPLEKSGVPFTTTLRKTSEVQNGVSVQELACYPKLFMQFSKRIITNSEHKWYKNYEYIKEIVNGGIFREDLYIPSDFTISLKKGESVVFAIGTKELDANSLHLLFENEYYSRKQPGRRMKIQAI